MKPIIIIALILLYAHFNDAHAAPFLVMAFNDETRIVLSTVKCSDTGYRAVAQRIDKMYMRGCYVMKNGMVHIQWEQGDFSEFPQDKFEKVEINDNFKAEM